MNFSTRCKCISLLASVLCLTTGCWAEEPSSDSKPPLTTPTASSVERAPANSTAHLVTAVPFDETSPTHPGGNCAVDAINGSAPSGAMIKTGAHVTFSGWIGDASNRVPSDLHLIMRSNLNTYSAPLVANGKRLDVAQALHAESLTDSGYNALVSINAEPGTYELSIVYGPNSDTSCALNTSLIVIS